MKSFEGKVIKLYLNNNYGCLTLVCKYIDMEDDFIVVENSLTNKIQYYSKYYIKYIEIVKDIEVESNEYDQ